MRFPRVVCLTVTCRDAEEFVTMYERLSRQVAGLKLDDLDARILDYEGDDGS